MTSSARGRLAGLRAGYLDRPYTSVQLLLLSGGLLLALGVLMATSTTISASLHDGNQGTPWTQLSNECLFLGVGLAACWAGVRITPRGYRLLAYPMLVLALVLMVAVLVPGIGVEINQAHRWFRLGPIQVQPSEFGKLALLVWGADLLARKDELGSLTRARHVVLPLVPAFFVVCGLVMLEPDLGTTLCFVVILLGLLWTAGLPVRYFLLMVGLVGGLVALFAVTAPYRMQRLTSFLDPFADASNTGHQAVQGLYALASGGVFGVGLGSGTSKYGWVPNANTDYVFAVVGEELGLLGALAVLGAFGLFAYAALRTARRSGDCFVRLAASGTAVWLCGQALINIGYVTALLPVTGIPLPFVSAGGTSLVLTMGVFGMLLSFARHEPAAVAATRAAAEAGVQARGVRLLRLGRPRAAGSGERRIARRAAAVSARSVPAPHDRPVAQPRPTAPRQRPAAARPLPATHASSRLPVPPPASGRPARVPASPALRGRPGRDPRQPHPQAQPREYEPMPLRPTGTDAPPVRR
ncbi:MAG: putative lipid II flippase FtsW [bacterium]